MATSVIDTLHNRDADRCVKIIRQPDGGFGFQEFRRDPEDAGRWTLVSETPTGHLATKAQALEAAWAGVAWLRDQVSGSRFQGPGTNQPLKPAP